MISKKKSELAGRLCGAAFIAIGAVSLYLWPPVGDPPPPMRPARVARVLDTQCLQKASMVHFHVDSEVALWQLPSPISENDVIEQQLNYVRNALLAQYPEVSHFSLTARKMDVRITRREETYTDLATNFRFDPGMLAPESPRLRYLIDQKVWPAGSPQRKIRYQAEGDALICAEALEPAERQFDLTLPLNPETAFWAVENDSWRDLRFKEKTQRLNPCTSDELADLPHPQYYWYFWNPVRVHDGVHCATALKPRTITAHARISPLLNVPVRPEASIAATRGSLIFGWLDTQFNAGTELREVADQARRILNGESHLGLQPNLFRDPSSTMLLETLSAIRRRSVNDPEFDFSLKNRKDFLELEISFARDRRLRIFWGPTDVLGNIPARHESFMSRALAEDDIVVYAGHASLGQSLLPRSTVDGRAPPPARDRQLLAFLSCYSVNYLNFDDLRSWTAADQLFVVTTASSMSRFPGAALALLSPIVSDVPLELAEFSPQKTVSDDQFVISEMRRPLETLAEEGVTQ